MARALLSFVFFFVFMSASISASDNLPQIEGHGTEQNKEHGNMREHEEDGQWLKKLSIAADFVSLIAAGVSVWTMTTVRRYRNDLIRKKVDGVLLGELNDVIEILSKYVELVGKPIPGKISRKTCNLISALDKELGINDNKSLKKNFLKIKDIKVVSSDNVSQIVFCLKIIQKGVVV